MNILHITPYYAPAYSFGGVVRAVEGLARAQVAAGHAVTVLTTDALDRFHRIDASDDVPGGVAVHRVPSRTLLSRRLANLSTPVGWQDALRHHGAAADVWHLHEFRTMEAWLSLRSPLAQGRRIVLTAHGTLATDTGRSYLKQSWDALLSHRMARSVDAVVGLTDDERADIADLWHRWNVSTTLHTIPNGVALAEFDALPDGSDFRQRHGIGQRRLVLFMARLHPRKGARLLLEAFRQLDGDRIDSDSVLMLAGPDEGDGDWLRQHSDPQRVIVPGYFGASERLAALAAADVFVLPAVGEGLPVTVLEAMAARLPVIITPGCHLPQVAQAQAGLVVGRDVVSLRDALQHVLADDALRRGMGQHGRHLVESHFTWARIASACDAVYQPAR